MDNHQLLISRRALLRSAAGAVAVAALPFGLKPSDLRELKPTPDHLLTNLSVEHLPAEMPDAFPVVPVHRVDVSEYRWELEPLEQLVVETRAPADREVLFEVFGALGDVVDSQPFCVSRVYPGLTLWMVIHDRAGVVVRCPGAVRVSAVVVGADFELKHHGVSFRPMELEEESHEEA